MPTYVVPAFPFISLLGAMGMQSLLKHVKYATVRAVIKCSDNKIVSQCRDQARRAYTGVVFEFKREIPVKSPCTSR
jgi:hypothetical protein